MDIQIEEMQNKHLELIDLSEFDNFWNMNMLSQEVSSPTSYYIIAKYNEDIVGFAGINFVLDEAHIANIVTKKNMRCLGIGSSLLAALIDKAKETCISITLEVNINNLAALKIYEKQNFKIVRSAKKILQQ